MGWRPQVNSCQSEGFSYEKCNQREIHHCRAEVSLEQILSCDELFSLQSCRTSVRASLRVADNSKKAL